MHKMMMRLWALVAAGSLVSLLYILLWEVMDEDGASHNYYLYGRLLLGSDGHSYQTWGEIAFIFIIFLLLLLLLALAILPLSLAFYTRCIQGIVILFAILTLMLLFQLGQLFYGGSEIRYRNFRIKGIGSLLLALLGILRSRFYLQMQHKFVRAAGCLRQDQLFTNAESGKNLIQDMLMSDGSYNLTYSIEGLLQLYDDHLIAHMCYNSL